MGGDSVSGSESESKSESESELESVSLCVSVPSGGSFRFFTAAKGATFHWAGHIGWLHKPTDADDAALNLTYARVYECKADEGP